MGRFSEIYGEQMPQDNASTLHNDTLHEMVYNMNNYVTATRTLKIESCHMQTLVPVATQEVAILTTHGVTRTTNPAPWQLLALNEGEF